MRKKKASCEPPPSPIWPTLSFLPFQPNAVLRAGRLKDKDSWEALPRQVCSPKTPSSWDLRTTPLQLRKGNLQGLDVGKGFPEEKQGMSFKMAREKGRETLQNFSELPPKVSYSIQGVLTQREQKRIKENTKNTLTCN